MKIKTNDQVKIIAGRDKGKTGKVMQVFTRIRHIQSKFIRRNLLGASIHQAFNALHNVEIVSQILSHSLLLYKLLILLFKVL